MAARPRGRVQAWYAVGGEGGAAGGEGGGGGGAKAAAAGAAQVWRGAHSRFALTSVSEKHSNFPFEGHQKRLLNATGTIVTSLATPKVRPPTVEATWVPCPSYGPSHP